MSKTVTVTRTEHDLIQEIRRAKKQRKPSTYVVTVVDGIIVIREAHVIRHNSQRRH
jgi:hypothetical protein